MRHVCVNVSGVGSREDVTLLLGVAFTRETHRCCFLRVYEEVTELTSHEIS